MRSLFPAVVLATMLMSPAIQSANGATADRWVEARSTHFVVLTNSNERDARHLAGQFERMHAVFHTLLPTRGDDSDPPIVVLAVRDRKGIRALEPEAYLAKDQMDLSGIFLRGSEPESEKNYILVRLDGYQDHGYSTVYHEYTHYMLRKADNWLPLWMNEGLAQFYENTVLEDKAAWLGETNAEQLRFLNRNELIPIATLLTVDAKSPYYHDEEKGSIFYAESWALAHYLIVGDRIKGTHRMRDYSQLLAQGQDSVTAARAAFGDPGELERGLATYIMQRKFMYFMMPVELAARDAAIDVEAVTTAQADAVRADVLVHTGRVNDARALLSGVLRDDPNNILAHETMGYVLSLDGDFEGARNWYEQAVALDSDSYAANYYYASMAMRGGGRREDEAIESSLRKAIRLNADFAPAYDALAMFYASRHRKLDEAYTLTLRAVELEPGRLSFRLNCAEVLTEKRQFTEALGILREAMRLTRTRDEVGAVSSRVAIVEREQVAMAGYPVRVRDEGGFGQ